MSNGWRAGSLILAVSMMSIAAWGAGTTTQIVVDPYTGSLHVESGEITVPLYEGTFQFETQYVIGFLLSHVTNRVGHPVTEEEIPNIESKVLQFWRNACCYASTWTCPPYREPLKFGVSVRDTRRPYEDAKDYTLFHLTHQALWEIGYTDAWQIPCYGAKRAFVTQIGQLKILTVVRGIGLLQMASNCPTSADFAIDVWVSIYPANVDLILQASRHPLWP